MSLDCQHEMKPLLYADLFKPNRNMAAELKEENTIVHKPKSGLSLSSSSSSNQFSYCDSSSSGFNSPLYSESSDDDGDFMAELTRQMAECMLQDEEEEVKEDSTIANDDKIKTPPVQVYELKKQPPISKEGSTVYRTESAQQKQVKKTEQHFRGKLGWGIGHGRNGQFGSGMQAVFLGGSGSKNGSSGTGVFLPRDSTDLKKKKPGCSMVLMPTRVLQALELHHNRYKDSTNLNPPSLTGGTLNYSYCPTGESTMSNGARIRHLQTANSDDMQLPQEWTY